MTDNIKQLLPLIEKHSIFTEYDFRLIGGTALSYHLQHRISEDLDFCIAGDLPTDAIADFIAICVEQFGEEQIDFIEPSQATKDDFEIHADTVENYLQNWKIKDVRVTFFDSREGVGTREILAENDYTQITHVLQALKIT